MRSNFVVVGQPGIGCGACLIQRQEHVQVEELVSSTPVIGFNVAIDGKGLIHFVATSPSHLFDVAQLLLRSEKKGGLGCVAALNLGTGRAHSGLYVRDVAAIGNLDAQFRQLSPLWKSKAKYGQQGVRLNGGPSFGDSCQLGERSSGFHLNHIQTPLEGSALQPSVSRVAEIPTCPVAMQTADKQQIGRMQVYF